MKKMVYEKKWRKEKNGGVGGTFFFIGSQPSNRFRSFYREEAIDSSVLLSHIPASLIRVPGQNYIMRKIKLIKQEEMGQDQNEKKKTG